MFDFICGTSTGGILALALGKLKMSAADCVALYKELPLKIFAYRSLLSVGLDKAMYDEMVLEKFLKEKLGSTALTENTSEPKVSCSPFF